MQLPGRGWAVHPLACGNRSLPFTCICGALQCRAAHCQPTGCIGCRADGQTPPHDTHDATQTAKTGNGSSRPMSPPSNAFPSPALPCPAAQLIPRLSPRIGEHRVSPLLSTSLISACASQPASQPGLSNNRAGATTWRTMGPRLVHPALHLTPGRPDSQTPCTLHPCACACAWACAHRTPVQPRTIPCISLSATVPYLYATAVPTLSILNLVVFPSTVADHPSLG